MQYLGTPTKTSFNFHCITEIETMKAIGTLENKSSSGHDGISNKIVFLFFFNRRILLHGKNSQKRDNIKRKITKQQTT